MIGNNCQWHPSCSKVTSVKLAAWGQIFEHSQVDYYKLYAPPRQKKKTKQNTFLELFLNLLLPIYFLKISHGFILSLNLKVEQLHFSHISFFRGTLGKYISRYLLFINYILEKHLPVNVSQAPRKKEVLQTSYLNTESGELGRIQIYPVPFHITETQTSDNICEGYFVSECLK